MGNFFLNPDFNGGTPQLRWLISNRYGKAFMTAHSTQLFAQWLWFCVTAVPALMRQSTMTNSLTTEQIEVFPRTGWINFDSLWAAGLEGSTPAPNLMFPAALTSSSPSPQPRALRSAKTRFNGLLS